MGYLNPGQGAIREAEGFPGAGPHTHPFTEITGVAVAAQIPSLAASKITSGRLAAAQMFQAPAQPNSTATDVAGLVADFNALLAKLRTAGILAP